MSCKKQGVGASCSEIRPIKLPWGDDERNAWVYLPPSYNEVDSLHYPVIYMYDGQNLFDDSLSYSGEWRIDETMDSMALDYNFEAIVVGIAHGEDKRILELTPYPNAVYGGGGGEDTRRKLERDVIPFIDGHFRTVAKREDRAIIGSSLGGLHAFYSAYKGNDFAKAGILSPSFWFSDSIYAIVKNGEGGELRLALSMGLQEDDGALVAVDRMDSILQDNPSQLLSYRYRRIAGGKHNERAWSIEFPYVIAYLFDLE